MAAFSKYLLLGCLAALIGCDAQKPGALPDPNSLMQATGSVREVRIKIDDYEFVPSQIMARPGERLRLVMESQGNQPHGITFDLPPGAVTAPQHLRKGESLRYEVTVPNRAGSYYFYCPVGDHFSRGMMGQIVAQP